MDESYDEDGQYIHTFHNLISIIESTEIVQQISEITRIYQPLYVNDNRT